MPAMELGDRGPQQGVAERGLVGLLVCVPAKHLHHHAGDRKRGLTEPKTVNVAAFGYQPFAAIVDGDGRRRPQPAYTHVETDVVCEGAACLGHG